MAQLMHAVANPHGPGPRAGTHTHVLPQSPDVCWRPTELVVQLLTHVVLIHTHARTPTFPLSVRMCVSAPLSP